MEKFKVVKTTQTNELNEPETTYHVEASVWLYWFKALTPTFVIHPKGRKDAHPAELTRQHKTFSTREECHEHMKEYFMSMFMDSYKGKRIEKMYRDVPGGKDRYFNMTDMAGGFHDSSPDINDLKQLIDDREAINR